MVMKNLLNKMKNTVGNLKQWWDKKTYKQKDSLGAMLQISLVIGLLFCMVALNAPLLQLALSLGLIVVSSSNLRRAWKHIKQREQEADEKIAELTKRNTERKLAEYQKADKRSYDKDTQEALQSLFDTGADKNSEMSVDEVERMEKSDIPSFNSMFNK